MRKLILALVALTSLLSLCAMPTLACGDDAECCKLHEGSKKAAKKKTATKHYVCSMCPDVCSDKPGKCPKCGMELQEGDAKGADKKHSH